MIATSQIQLRHLFKVFSGSTPESGKGFYWDGNIFWVTPEDVSSLTGGYKLYDTKRKITEEGYENSGVKLVPENSIVLTKRAPIGLLAILGIEACSNQGCFLLVPKEGVVPEFYYYFLLANKGYLQILGRGSTFMELSQDDLKPLKVPNLIHEKQLRVAEFLDKETKRIDDLIKEKESQLTLLSEKRQALITQAVTKGINPNIKLRDSGIDWLGKVPEHWEVKKLKYCASITLGKMLTNEDGGKMFYKPYLRAANINWYHPDVSDIKHMWFSDWEIEKLSINKGDLLVSEGGEVGRTCIWNNELEESYIQNSVHKVRVYGNQNPHFFLYQFILMGNLGFFASIVNRISIAHLTVEKLKEIYFVEAPLKEQNEIVEYIQKHLNLINEIESATKLSIQLLKERIESLISEAVTGQIEI